MTSTRLLTLVGTGGIGKTRLALQAAAEVMAAYRDGVWLVDLAPLTDPALVPSAVAQVLGVREAVGKTLIETLCRQVKGRELLLVLDNCEHLLDGCAKVADALLRQCRGVQILASSREALGISGEQAYRVPSLSLPDPKQVHSPVSVAQFEAIQLFTDRALLARPNFRVTDQNASTLASVCYRLDGIPLAIELAATRVRSLSLEEIDGKLDQRFRLLTGGSRTALPRQQTLRSLIDWSYDLLNDPEKLLLQRLSVFAGGWTLEAVERVCAGEGMEEWEILDLLTSLSDKSLVMAEQDDEHSRYRLLDTVRQYALEKLAESGGGEAVRKRHLDHFLALAEEAEPKLISAQQTEWLQRLDKEYANLRSAQDWSFVEAGSGQGLRLCGALQRYWVTRGHLSEGREWCMRALGKAGAEDRTHERAKALNSAGLLAYYQADFPAARALNEESLAIRRQLGDRRGIAPSLNNLGLVACDQGDYRGGSALYEESLAIKRELGDRSGIANLLNNLGNAAYERGDFVFARALHEESLAIRREVGDRQGLANSLNSLGNLASDQGDFASAQSLHEESLAIKRELGYGQGIASSLNSLGNLASDQGDLVSARARQEESLTIVLELGDRWGIARSLAGLAAVVATLGNSLRAAQIWGAAERLRAEVGAPLSPNERSHNDRTVAASRATLGDDAAFDHAWQEGRALTLEQAIELALEETVARP